MQKDIVKITKKVFNMFILDNKLFENKRRIYDVYRSLESVIEYSKLVSEHYLVLDFNEEYLQNTSFGKPSDKWNYFFNKDLECLNNSIKKHLHSLEYLCIDNKNLIASLYYGKVFHAFVRDHYNVGFLNKGDFTMISNVLTTNFDNENIYISKFIKTDLSKLEDRVLFQSEIRRETKKLEYVLYDLKEYIIKNITLEELL